VVDGVLVHEADLRWVDASASGDVEDGGEGIACCEDQFGLGKAEDVIEFLGVASGV
jgi:hypothetical protein